MIWFLFACTSEKQPEIPCTSFVGLSDSTEIISFVDNSCSTIDLSPQIIAEGDIRVKWEKSENVITPILTADTDAVFSGLVLTGDYTLKGEAETRIWKQGYQSWWWSGVTELFEPEYDDQGIPLVGGDGNGTSAVYEQPYSSWWLGLIGKEDGDSILAGALASTKTRVWTAFSAEKLWIVWGHRGDSIALSAGEELRLDPVWIHAGTDAFDLHVQYAQVSAAHNNVEPREDRPPIGWATWYTFYEDIDEEIILGNLAVAEELAADPSLEPMTVFQIDDGWQKLWGDWTANEGFPSGMAQLADDIHTAGFDAGLWMAPFYVHTDTVTFQEHNDWWVLDENDDPILFTNFGSGNYAIIDVTHPDAGPWMRDQVAQRREEGWNYLKLDFLYAGAEIGKRYQDVTGMEAYHIGMQYLKEASGDSFFLACGAPMLPSLGYADAFRTGADIGFNFDPGPRHEYLRWQTRATMSRSWQNGIWWWVDPDQMLLRDPFEEPQVRGSIVANLISGGSWLIGDDLRTVQRERLELALRKDIVALSGQLVKPINPLSYISGADAGPVAELGDPDDVISPQWEMEDGTELLLNMTNSSLSVDASGGLELFSQETDTSRSLEVGAGEIWLAPQHKQKHDSHIYRE